MQNMNLKKNIYHEVQHLWWGFRLLYGIAFIGSGADKFLNILIDWHKQDSALIETFGISMSSMLSIRGMIELLIGIALFTRAVKPSAYAACLCLLLSALYMFFVPGNLDTALRYAVIAWGAYVLARLTIVKEKMELL